MDWPRFNFIGTLIISVCNVGDGQSDGRGIKEISSGQAKTKPHPMPHLY